MSVIEGLLIFFAIVLIYFVLVIVLKNRGILEKFNISLYGPALLLRTTRGHGFLKKIASKSRFWKAFGSFGIVFCFIAMLIMVTIFIWQAWMFLGLDLTPEQKAGLPGPEFALILPGINPILPLEYLFYIILALFVAIIVHEFSHGILTIAGKIKVKSLGILYLIVPIGAFCEPDEEELKKTETVKRMRVFAAGPLANFTVAFIVLLLFSFVFMSAVQPADGAEILYIYEDTPAEEIGLSTGALITSINDTQVKDIEEFRSAIEKINPNHEVNISYLKNGDNIFTKVTLTSVYDYITPKNESYKNTSFLGVGLNSYGGYLSALKNPFTYDFPHGFLLLFALPIFGYYTGYNPLAAPFTNNHEITGPLSILPSNVFWGIITALYWIFWLNIMVGLFNVLPIIPLDGGFLFNDAVGSAVKKIKKDVSEETHKRIVKNISLVVSLIVLSLVLFPFFIKYI